MNIKSLCLGILYFEDATGYEINKYASEGHYSHFIEASYGSIYPTLTKLTQDGMVTFRLEAQDGKPNRKIYSITEIGRNELISSLSEPPKNDIFKSEFLFICLQAELVSRRHMTQVLNDKLQALENELAEFHSCDCGSENDRSKFVIGYGEALCRAALTYIQKNRGLLETDQVHTEPTQITPPRNKNSQAFADVARDEQDTSPVVEELGLHHDG